MREIKFRAWDKTNKWMDNEFSIHADGCIYQDARRRWDISDIAIESAYDDLEIMQFTGLLDKNGKEIYESDVLNKKTTYENNMSDKRFQPATQINVGFEQGNFIDKNSGRTLYDAMRTISSYGVKVWTNYEIMGNELENPDLL